MKTYTVSNRPDAECDFTSIAAAFQSLGQDDEPVTIFIKEGIYHELLRLNRPNVILQGEGADRTIISFNLYALQLMEDGKKRGTFRTQTLFLDAGHITLRDLTIQNTAGFGRKYGQALAVYADGDVLIFENCRLLGSQDTLFTGPLPPTPYELGGFTGPKEHCPRINGRHLYKNCYIRGDVDFIFGSATAYFEDCEIFSQKTDDLPPADNPAEQKNYGYITAASTAEGQEYGYVFNRCRLTSDCPPASVYLGRPWRNYAKTVFMNCELGAHIRPEGWHDWNKEDARKNCFYAEYNNSGPGAQGLLDGRRASFVKLLSKEEAEHFTREKVLGF